MQRCLVLVLCYLSWAVATHAQPYAVPLVELIAHPTESLEKYREGVITIGYLSFGAGDAPTLFLTRDHALAKDVTSAVYLADDTVNDDIYGMKCDNEYVEVVGTLVFLGARLNLSRIETIRRTEDSSFCFSRRRSDSAQSE